MAGRLNTPTTNFGACMSTLNFFKVSAAVEYLQFLLHSSSSEQHLVYLFGMKCSCLFNKKFPIFLNCFGDIWFFQIQPTDHADRRASSIWDNNLYKGILEKRHFSEYDNVYRYEIWPLLGYALNCGDMCLSRICFRYSWNVNNWTVAKSFYLV